MIIAIGPKKMGLIPFSLSFSGYVQQRKQDICNDKSQKAQNTAATMRSAWSRFFIVGKKWVFPEVTFIKKVGFLGTVKISHRN